jgi:1-acyl-sn-glycerol-3-phosphate acyltransferase
VLVLPKSRWFSRFFAGHAQKRLGRTFGRVLVGGLDEAKKSLAEGPILVVANHSTWWDALVALVVSELWLGADAHALMDAKNLRRVPFFGRVGAFGVDLDDPADGARALRHAARLLDRPGRLVWIFPEGRERSPYEPLTSDRLMPGSAQIARLAKKATLVPIGLRYVFGEAEAPDLFIAIGAPRQAARDVQEGRRQQAEAIGAELARADAAIAARDVAGFSPVMMRGESALGRLAERALASLFPLPRD